MRRYLINVLWVLGAFAVLASWVGFIVLSEHLFGVIGFSVVLFVTIVLLLAALITEYQ